jgi:hypothetical protein
MINVDQLAHPVLTRRRSQVVRQRSAKPLSIGSIPIAASIHLNHLQAAIENKVLLFGTSTTRNEFFKSFSADLNISSPPSVTAL